MLPIHRAKFSVFNYDDIPAGYYHQVMLSGHPVQKFWHRVKFENISAMIEEGSKVLDLGCGPGSFLSILAVEKKDIDATGVDVAAKQIEFATREIASADPKGRLKFVRLEDADMRLPFPDASFDVVTSIEVIEHIHPYFSLKLIEEAKRVLKPDGKIIVTTPNYRSFWPFIEKILEFLSPVKYHDQHINKYTPNSLSKFLESGGLEVGDVKSIFILAPFLAVISRRFARFIHALEKHSRLRLGSLLIAEAKKLSW